MKTIREFEERLHVEIATGEIPGFTHLYSGQARKPWLPASARR
jgi:pyruvate dehydrogenase E1 component alpha subunit